MTTHLLALAVALAAEGAAARPASLARLPLYFVEQRDGGGRLVGFRLADRRRSIELRGNGIALGAGADGAPALQLELAGARPGLVPEGADDAPATIGSFRGPREAWTTARAHDRVVYRDVWPGIDASVAGDPTRLEYTFHLAPEADPDRIRVRWRGATAVTVDPRTGALAGRLAGGVRLGAEPPIAWEVGGRVVRARYRTRRVAGIWEFGIAVEGRDPQRALVIDPAVLVFSGYLGGMASDEVRAIAVDAAGNAYLAGRTVSTETSFPVAGGPATTYGGGSQDAFVAKVAGDGTSLLWAGYIGGAESDAADGIAVDAGGAVYVAGSTTSSEATFPVRVGPRLAIGQNPSGLRNDAFVAKVAPDGTGLVYCGYIGGEDEDVGRAIAVDGAGAAYVAGMAYSTEATFPVRTGPMTVHLNALGGPEGFVAKVLPDGSDFAWSGFVGGSEGASLSAIALDGAGAAYVAGSTSATTAGFPALVGPDLTANGLQDAIVAKVLPDGSGFAYAGFLGGSGDDNAHGIAVDATGRAVVAGYTRSDAATFPVAVGPDLTPNGGMDGFIARVRADGTALDAAGFFGGSLDDWPRAVALDGLGRPLVAGGTSSSETTFPVLDGPDLTYNGTGDAFVARVAADFSRLEVCGYIGGSRQEVAFGVAADAAHAIYVAGFTESSQASFPVVAGPDLTFNSGTRDGWVAKVAVTGACATSAREIRRLLAVEAGAGVAASWDPDPAANGYNLWRVRAKTDIDLARQASAPPAEPVPDCAHPSPVALPACTDAGAVTPTAGNLLFYQARSFCDPTSEGP